ncbi:YqcC family protein [Otariodibacter sp.]|uniref:YqcC family protein n=1 Tax=Otariodibacter sp. TaxID=3030919 RepID=UPI00260588F8|nr:YqcC family protein [Otariodibacter sp.]
MKQETRKYINEVEAAMKKHNLWEATPPSEEALASTDPFCVNALSPSQWLQWIFIPKMNALLDANADLPKDFAITPYLEEALKEEAYLMDLHTPLLKLEQLLKS